LRDVEQTWFKTSLVGHPDPSSPFYPREDGMRRLALRELDNWFWACDQCLKSGRALRADTGRHKISLGTSFAAYVDRPFQCDDCGQPSLFSAAEQKYWFETLQFLIWVYPKQCAPCRKKRRQGVTMQKALQKALKTLDPTDAKQMEEVAKLYEAIGIEAKAALYRARAKNRATND
jgi:hypothetical protein